MTSKWRKEIMRKWRGRRAGKDEHLPPIFCLNQRKVVKRKPNHLLDRKPNKHWYMVLLIQVIACGCVYVGIYIYGNICIYLCIYCIVAMTREYYLCIMYLCIIYVSMYLCRYVHLCKNRQIQIKQNKKYK